MSGLLIFGILTMVTASAAMTVCYFWWYIPPPVLDRSFNDFRFQLQNNAIYAVPLRIFIGLGWLRAGIEKLADDSWLSGEALAAFLTGQLDHERIVFPAYQALVSDLFLPAAASMVTVIIVGELLCGAAILTGTFTNAALFCGIFMNLNFILAGETNPSAFYIVIQMALLATAAGSVLGFDRLLSRTHTRGWLVAQPAAALRTDLRPYAAALVFGLLTALYAILHVRDLSPSNSVEDPAMILAILALSSSFWLAISIARVRVDRLQYLALPGTDRAPGSPV